MRVRDLLIKLSSNGKAQHLLERAVVLIQYLMGIGSGTSAESSGESVLVEELHQMRTTQTDPLCVFDVGSNRGQFLRVMVDGLQRAGLPFFIHAFEPSKLTYGILHDNFTRHANLILNNFGLGKQGGEFHLFYDQIGSGLASLSKRRLDHLGIEFTLSEKVTIRTLDEYCSSQGVQSIDLLKLDVEGHELDVLQGGLRMFQEKRVRMVSFEFGGCNIDTRTYFQDFWYFFQENGMGNIYRIAPSGHLVHLVKYKELYEQFRTTNFLAHSLESYASEEMRPTNRWS